MADLCTECQGCGEPIMGVSMCSAFRRRGAIIDQPSPVPTSGPATALDRLLDAVGDFVTIMASRQDGRWRWRIDYAWGPERCPWRSYGPTLDEAAAEALRVMGVDW